MEACKYESEIKRVIKLLDGNGQKGMIKEFERLISKQYEMQEYITNLVKTAEAQSKSINAFQRYQNSEELLKDERKKREDEREQWDTERKKTKRFVIAQSIATLGILAAVLIALLIK